jgi:hypothetical protein
MVHFNFLQEQIAFALTLSACSSPLLDYSEDTFLFGLCKSSLAVLLFSATAD